MRPYRLVTPAYRDLENILEYLNSKSASAASRFLLSLDQRLRLVAQHPHMGVKRTEFGHPQIRFVVHANYMIAYDPESETSDHHRHPTLRT